MCYPYMAGKRLAVRASAAVGFAIGLCWLLGAPSALPLGTGAMRSQPTNAAPRLRRMPTPVAGESRSSPWQARSILLTLIANPVRIRRLATGRARGRICRPSTSERCAMWPPDATRFRQVLAPSWRGHAALQGRLDILLPTDRVGYGSRPCGESGARTATRPNWFCSCSAIPSPWSSRTMLRESDIWSPLRPNRSVTGSRGRLAMQQFRQSRTRRWRMDQSAALEKAALEFIAQLSRIGLSKVDAAEALREKLFGVHSRTAASPIPTSIRRDWSARPLARTAAAGRRAARSRL